MKSCIKLFAGAFLVAALVFTGCSSETETEKLTQEQMVSKLDEASKNAIFEAVLAGKNADALLAKLSNEQKAALVDKMFTDETKAEIFDELLTDEKKTEIYKEMLTETEKAAIFDELLATKTSKDFIVGILTKDGNEALYAEVKDYITGKLTQAELVALLDATDTTAPGDVTNLTASPKANAVVLTWTDGENADNDLYGYLVSWKTSAPARSVAALEKDTMLVAKSSKDDKSNEVTVTGLTAGTKYTFTVQAIDLIGNKSAGETIEATPVEAAAGSSMELSIALSSTEPSIRDLTATVTVATSGTITKVVYTDKAASSVKNLLATGTPAVQSGSVYEIPVKYNGTYTVAAIDSDGKTSLESLEVTNLAGVYLDQESGNFINRLNGNQIEFTSLKAVAGATVSTSIGAENGPFYTATETPVTVADFQIAKYELTYELWYYVYNWAKENGYSFNNGYSTGYEYLPGPYSYSSSTTNYDAPTEGKHYPVSGITWRNAKVWCNALSELCGFEPVYYTDADYQTPLKTSTTDSTLSEGEGSQDKPYIKAAASGNTDIKNCTANGYRLPTEAEWEFAARGGDPLAECWNYRFAGTDTMDEFDEDKNLTTTDSLSDYCWYVDNSNNQMHEVGLKKPNALGLYDMCGNEGELIEDDGSIGRGGSYSHGGEESKSVITENTTTTNCNNNTRKINNTYYSNTYNNISFRIARGAN